VKSGPRTGTYFGIGLALLFCSISAAGQQPTKKAEAATGSVTGSVSCADTNAPARFAVVTLQRVPEEVSETGKQERDGPAMNPTATTDMDGRFFLDKVAPGRYFVVGGLAGYLNPLSRFTERQLQQMSDETGRELARTVPIVSVAPNQGASVSLRLEHASELSGTVLYDDGSPAVSLDVRLLHKDKDGRLSELRVGLVNGLGVSGSTSFTDDRGRYRMIGAPAGEYTVIATLPTQRVSLGGLFGGGISVSVVGQEGSGLSIYLGDTFRKKDAKTIKVGDGEQVGGLDITIPGNGLHAVRGVVTAKRDDHALSQAHIELLYADDREVVRSVDVHDEGGEFEFSYVPVGQYILRLSGAADTERVERHEFNSNFTENRTLRMYGETELPLLVQGDMSGVDLAAPDLPAAKAAQ